MRPLRSKAVLSVVSGLFAAYAKATLATLRWTEVNGEAPRRYWKGEASEGVIVCLWHHAIPLSAPNWRPDQGARPLRALISRSQDGEFIARVMQSLGYASIRGSSRKDSDKAKNKHGEQAFREMVRFVRDGNAVAVTPDGPRGPAMQMQMGIVALARTTGAPVLLMGMACNPSLRLNSWDRTVTPLPFGRAATIWEEVRAGRDDDPETLRADWERRMHALDRRANAMVGNSDG